MRVLAQEATANFDLRPPREGRKCITMSGYNEREAKAAFDAAHGERVEWNYWFFFADGACRSNESISEMRPPPADEFERAQMILTFHRARLTRAVQAFNNLKENLSHQSGNGNELSHLEELRRIVGKRRREVEKAQAALDDTDVGRMRKGAREWRREEMMKQAEWQSKLREMRI